MAFWGLKVEPKKWTPFVPPPEEALRLHISQAALAAAKAPKNGSRTVVKCRAEADDDEESDEFVVCVIIGGVVESCHLDLVFGGYCEFFADGDHPVHLTGFFMPMEDYDIEDEFGGAPVYGGDEMDSDDDEFDDEDDESEDEDDFAALEEFDDEDEDEDSEDEPRATKKGGVEIKEIVDDKPKKRKEQEPVAKKQEPPAKKEKKEPKKEAPVAKKEEKKVEKKAPSEPAKQGQLKREFKNGMEIVNLQMGKPDGKHAKPGKNVTMKYIGKLQSGKIFDQTKGNATFRFRLGVGEVIKGWDVGVDGMRVGDKRRLVIPPAMAYGKKGVKGAIPGGATLVFEVELVNVQ